MNLEAIQTPDPVASVYLEHLQALALEISLSMDAIVESDLQRLQETTAKQEALCANLATMASAFGDGDRKAGPKPANRLDPAVEKKINAARLAVGSTESAVRGSAQAFGEIDRSPGCAMQKPHRKFTGGLWVQGEKTNLVLRDVSHGFLEYFPHVRGAIAQCCIGRSANHKQ